MSKPNLSAVLSEAPKLEIDDPWTMARSRSIPGMGTRSYCLKAFSRERGCLMKTPHTEVLTSRNMPDQCVKLFQYGSNMDPDRLNVSERLDGAAIVCGVARLEGWGIRFDLYSTLNRCGVTDVSQSQQEYVLGILYDVPMSLVIADGQRRSRMDEIEGARIDGSGNYQRMSVTVVFQGRTFAALTYVGTRSGKERFAARTPQEQRVSVQYFNFLETGAARFDFPNDYRDYLRAKAGLLRA